jgi:hypothetical protein
MSYYGVSQDADKYFSGGGGVVGPKSLKIPDINVIPGQDRSSGQLSAILMQTVAGLAVGIALVMYGRLEEADPLITSLCKDKDAILRRSNIL